MRRNADREFSPNGDAAVGLDNTVMLLPACYMRSAGNLVLIHFDIQRYTDSSESFLGTATQAEPD